MKQLLLNILRWTSLFFGSLILGAGVCFGYSYWKTMPENVVAGATPQQTASEVIEFDGKAAKLAKADRPVDLSIDAMSNSYILQQNGEIVRIGMNVEGEKTVIKYASLSDSATEQAIGFSAVAFHPGFLSKDSNGYGRFYVVAAEKANTAEVDFAPKYGADTENHQDVVYEFRANDPYAETFTGEKREVIRLSQPGAENNLKSIVFDMNSFLYLGVGDGASAAPGADAPSRNASDLLSAYGKILRIDPLAGTEKNPKYGVPTSNPFRISPVALPEIWACGLRAPQNLTYDPFRATICISERGYKGISEVNLSVTGAEHFGWDLCEGSKLHKLNLQKSISNIVTTPQVEFDAAKTSSENAGGFVYRGERFPSLVGKLIFANDQGELMSTEATAGKKGSPINLLDNGTKIDKTVAALRPGLHGEIFLLCTDGDILEIEKPITAANAKRKRRPIICALF